MNSSMKSKFLYINKRSTPFILAYVVFLFNYILNGYEFGATVESVRLTAAALLLFACVQKRRKDSFFIYKWLSAYLHCHYINTVFRCGKSRRIKSF